MAYQVVVRQSSSPCIKTEQGIPERKIDAQEPAKTLGTALRIIVRSLTNRPSYTTVTYM